MLLNIVEVLEMTGIEEVSPIDDEVQPIKTFDEYEGGTNFNGF